MKLSDNEIDLYINAKVHHELGGYVQADGRDTCLLTNPFIDETDNSFRIAVLPAVDSEEKSSRVVAYFDKVTQPAPDGDCPDDRRDVFDDIGGVLTADGEQNVCILFPYNIYQSHWLTGEVEIRKSANSSVTVSFNVHNPYGSGIMGQTIFDTVTSTVKTKLESLGLANVVISDRTASIFATRRQARGDVISCGAIVAHELVGRISRVRLDREAEFSNGAPELREGLYDEVKQLLTEGELERFRKALFDPDPEVVGKPVNRSLDDEFVAAGTEPGEGATAGADSATSIDEPERDLSKEEVLYTRYYDDTSDEESFFVEPYEVEAGLKSFEKGDRGPLKDLTETQRRMIFYSHAFGRMAMRAPEVQKHHTVLKRRLLTNKESLIGEEELRKIVRESLNATLLKEVFVLPKGYEDLSKFLCKDFTENNSVMIERFIDGMVSNKRTLMRFVSYEAPGYPTRGLARYCQRRFNSTGLIGAIRGFLDNIDYLEFILENYDFNVAEGVRDIEKADLNNDKIRSAIGSFLSEQYSGAASKFAAEAKRRDGRITLAASRLGSQRLKRIESFQSPYHEKSFRALHGNSSGSGSGTPRTEEVLVLKLDDGAVDAVIEEFIDTDVAERKNHPVFMYIAYDLVSMRLYNLDPLLTCNFLQETNSDLEPYLSLSTRLAKTLNSRVVMRRTLGDAHVFDCSSAATFLSSLLVSNRSIRRHIRNRPPKHDEEVDIFRVSTERHPTSWQFADGRAKATDVLSIGTAGSRVDETVGLGSYRTVLSYIEAIKASVEPPYSITDSDVALWIRDVFKGGDLVTFTCSDPARGIVKFPSENVEKQVRDCIVRITYLIMGSEVVRNPSSLIQQNMMLDLIIAKRIDWKEAIDSETRVNGEDKDGNPKEEADGGLMPMSMKEAVSSARRLHYIMNENMPYVYYYDPLSQGSDSRVIELAEREAELMRLWLDYKLYPHVSQEDIEYLYHFCDKSGVLTEWKLDYSSKRISTIFNAVFNEWFGFAVKIGASTSPSAGAGTGAGAGAFTARGWSVGGEAPSFHQLRNREDVVMLVNRERSVSSGEKGESTIDPATVHRPKGNTGGGDADAGRESEEMRRKVQAFRREEGLGRG